MAVLTIIYRILAWFVPVLFLLSGSIKLYPWNAAVHQELLGKFEMYSDVFPTALLKLYVPPPGLYMSLVGTLEFTCAIAMLVGPLMLRLIANFLLVCTMIGACVVHVQLQYSLAEAFAAVVCLISSLMLLQHTWKLHLIESSSQKKE